MVWGITGSPSMCPHQAHVNGPTAPTPIVSARRGRKGDVQMGGAQVICTPATGQNTIFPLPSQPLFRWCHHPLQWETEDPAIPAATLAT